MDIRQRGWSFGVATLALGSSLSVNARAQTPPAAADEALPTAPAAPASNASAGSDVVRLKSGGVVRGKISELLPGDSVTIISNSGKTHEFEMSEVSYAGAEAQDPTKAPAAAPAAVAGRQFNSKATSESKPYVTVYGPEAKLYLRSSPAGLTFHRQDSAAIAYGRGGVAHATGYARLCTTPCSVSLPAGTETLAVSADGDTPVSAGPVTFPAGESTLNATYEDNSAIRIGGYALMAVSLVAGGVLIFTASKDGECDSYGYCPTTMDSTQLIVGTTIGIGGSLVGLGLAMVSDSASVQRTASALPPEPRARFNLPPLGLRSTF